MTPAIEVATDSRGTLTYLIHDSPAALPPVLRRDLLGAWEAARAAALAAGRPGARRAFRFARPDGATTDLALSDPDAQCWAGAVDRRLNMASPYGMSVCLRLLALIDLLAASPWARTHCDLRRTGADLHPGLLRLAAEAKLTDEAGFDEAAFRARLNPALMRTDRPSGQGAPP
jgi:hypothetical protein